MPSCHGSLKLPIVTTKETGKSSCATVPPLCGDLNLQGCRVDIGGCKYGIAYSPSAYARMRMKEPFARVENKYED